MINFGRKTRVGYTRKSGVGSAFIFDASKGLPLVAWTSAQLTLLVRHIRQFDNYCSNLKLSLVDAGWFSLLHPRLEQYHLVFPKTILLSPFAFRMCVTSCPGSFSATSC